MDVHAPAVASDASILDRFRIADPRHDPTQGPARRVDAPGVSDEATGDSVLLSPAARELAEQARPGDDEADAADAKGSRESESANQAPGTASEPTETRPGELTDEEEEQVRELRDRDQEVRAHENAHKAAAGGLARGGPVYEYETGPDGRRYAVGGHVNIAVGEGRTPQETLQNATQARRAALAPAQPSGQDRAVAAKAAALAADARQEIAEERRQQAEEANGGDSDSDDTVTGEPAGDDTGSDSTAATSSSVLGLAIDAYGAATRDSTAPSAFGIVG